MPFHLVDAVDFSGRITRLQVVGKLAVVEFGHDDPLVTSQHLARIEWQRVDVAEVSQGHAAACGISVSSIDVGESGLLTRMMIPIIAASGPGDCSVTGKGTLLRRPLNSASDIMAAFGVLLANAGEHRGKEIFVPLEIKGKLIPGSADVPGSGAVFSSYSPGFAISETCKDRDAAWSFVRTFLTQEYQENNGYYGFAVNKAVFDKYFEQALSEEYNMGYVYRDGGEETKTYTFTEADRDMLLDVIENTAVFMDTSSGSNDQLTQIVNEEADQLVMDAAAFAEADGKKEIDVVDQNGNSLGAWTFD